MRAHARLAMIFGAALLAGVGWAQPAPPSSVTKAIGEDIVVTWTHPGTDLDGDPIAGITATRVYWSPVEDGECGQWTAEVTAPWDDTTVTIEAGTIPDGEWCLEAYYVHPEGNSGDSLPAAVTVVGGDPQPDPEPDPGDTGLTLSDVTVYTSIRLEDRYFLEAAGEAPIGTECVDTSSVNAFHVVPREAVSVWYGRDPEDPESFRAPLAVVGDCE